MNTVHERLRHLREEILGLPLREFRDRVNRELADDAGLSLGTLSNYEHLPGGARRPGPRAEFLAALKHAFPQIRLTWVILGEGQPTELAERLASPDGLDKRAAVGAGERRSPDDGSRFAARVLYRYPDLELLAPEASALFMAALTRLAMGEPRMALDEEHLLELAGDLRWMLLYPVGVWGFRHAPAYRELSSYAVAMLHALSQLMPDTGLGDEIDRYAASAGPRFRELHAVGF